MCSPAPNILQALDSGDVSCSSDHSTCSQIILTSLSSASDTVSLIRSSTTNNPICPPTFSSLANATVVSTTSQPGNYNVDIGKGPVTILSTIEVIPEPLTSSTQPNGSGFVFEDSQAASAQAPDVLIPAVGLITGASLTSSTTSPSPLVTTYSSAVLRRTSQVTSPSMAGEVISQAQTISAQLLLPPVIVGGITYAPVAPAPGTESAISDNSGGASAAEMPPNASTESAALQPIVVGGLTYTRVGEGRMPYQPTISVHTPAAGPDAPGMQIQSAIPHSQSQTSTGISFGGVPATDGGEAVTSSEAKAFLGQSMFVVGIKTTLVSYTKSSNATGSHQHTASPTNSLVVNASSTLTGFSSSKMTGTTGVGLGSITAPPVFTIAGEIFTAYPKGLAIDGTEVFQGSSAITISGTAISLGHSDLVIGSSTIDIASFTGLGLALSSGLAAPTAAGFSRSYVPALTTGSSHLVPHSSSEKLQPVERAVVIEVLVAFAAVLLT